MTKQENPALLNLFRFTLSNEKVFSGNGSHIDITIHWNTFGGSLGLRLFAPNKIIWTASAEKWAKQQNATLLHGPK